MIIHDHDFLHVVFSDDTEMAGKTYEVINLSI